MNHLVTLVHANIPCVNSWESFVASQDKAVMYGKLSQVQRDLGGWDAFPLVSQTCYSAWGAATFPPDFPCVGKIGTASGGLGKMKIAGASEWEDFCSVAAMQPQFFTSESFIPWDYDIRIQKIGNHYRAFRRTAKHWKSNVDFAMQDEDIEVEERYMIWIEAAAQACGMDICAMDVLRVEETGKEYILELNSSAIGLNGRHQEEDSRYIRDLVLRRMENIPPPEMPVVHPVDPNKYIEVLQLQVRSLQEEINQLCGTVIQLEENAAQSNQEGDKKKSSFFGRKRE